MRTAAAVRGGRATALASLCLLFALVTAFAVTSGDAHAEFGFVPGSTVGKTHEPAALKCGFGGVPSNRARCRVDIEAIRGFPATSQAGGHPDATAAATLPPRQEVRDATRDIVVVAPPGFVGSPTVVTECDRARFAVTGGGDGGLVSPEEECPISSQLGVVTVFAQGMTDPRTFAIYRITPTPGYPASFGFKPLNDHIAVVANVNVRTDGDYGITVFSENITAQFKLFDLVGATLFGVPAASFNDQARWNPFAFEGVSAGGFGTLAGLPQRPLLATPADCSNGELETTLRLRSWQAPEVWLPDALPVGDPRRADYTIPVPQPTGCDQLAFEPGIALAPSTRDADSATGGKVTVEIQQNEDPDGLATPPLRKAVVTLPEGLTINPSAADGQLGCTTAQIGLLTTTGEYPNPIRFAKGDGSCPDAAKVGTAVVHTPALDDPVPGDVYVAEPHDNPYGSLFAMYLVVRGPGFTAKLPGLVQADPDTGRLTTTFDHSPQLPVESVELDLFGGPRAALATPQTCGEKTTTTELTPWSAPQSGPPAEPATAFEVTRGPAGMACAATLGSRPFALGFNAGSVSALAGEFSPFALRLRRPGGNQELDRVEVSTPKGFAANLSQVPYCPEAGIAQAIARTASGDGAVEKADPSCPEASRVGTTTIGAGAGPAPFYVKGNMYLAGPYEGAPLSAVFVVPAVAGPFDLGVQVVRAAIHVDRKTAQVTTISDVIPKILEGVPFRIQDVRVDVDRDRFTVNPSSCAEKAVAGQIAGSHGATARVSNRFQATDCAALPFKPRLAMRLTGRKQTRTGRHPGIRAQVNQTGVGEAGIKKAVVRLPKSLALDPDNAQALCEFDQGTKDDLEDNCPKGSIVGRAKAVSPLLKRPLAGNVYFVKNIRIDKRTGNQIRTLPMIVVALRGEVAINLYGKSSTTPSGKLVNTFDDIPDAPISQFNININGGQNGILAVTRTRRSNINLCAGRHTAEADIDGQNGRRHDFDVRMKTPCTRKQTKAAKRQAKRAAAKARRG